jgi:hypothetical protein
MNRLAALILLAPALLLAEDYTERQVFTHPLAAGGKVYLKNDVGEIHVTTSGRSDVRIIAVKKARDSDEHSGPGRLKELRVQVNTSPDEIRIRGVWPHRDVTRLFRGKSRLQIDYELEVPRGVRLHVENDIGEVHITGADNDVIVRNGIGEAYVGLADSFQPRRVYLHTKIGELQSDFPGRSSGFLGRKFTRILDGKSTLDVRVSIGEIRIRGGKMRKVTEL